MTRGFGDVVGYELLPVATVGQYPSSGAHERPSGGLKWRFTVDRINAEVASTAETSGKLSGDYPGQFLIVVNRNSANSSGFPGARTIALRQDTSGNVSKSIFKLDHINMIITCDNVPRRNSYQFTPHLIINSQFG